MKQKKYTKRALCMSLLSMLLCCSMLIGTTFAWFTDSVTSGRNQIVAGNLDVELEYAKAEDAEDGTINEEEWKPVTGTTTDLFGSALWEPGHTEYVYLRVRNNGSLALKYSLAANVYGTATGEPEKTYHNIENGTFQLSQYLVFNVIDSVEQVTDRTALWISDSDKEAAAMGKLDGIGTTGSVLYPKGTAGEISETAFTLAIYMPTSVGNVANWIGAEKAPDGETAPEIYFGLNLLASQYTYEKDSFGDQYDKDATGPDGVIPVSTETKPVGDIANSPAMDFVFDHTNTLPDGNGTTEVVIDEGAIPEDAFDETKAEHTVELSIKTVFENYAAVGDDAGVVKIDLSLLVDGKEWHDFDTTKPVTVKTVIPTGLKNVNVVYNGGEGDQPTDVDYTKETGVLTFKTNHFSEFEVTSDMPMIGKAAADALRDPTKEEVVLDGDIDLGTEGYGTLSTQYGLSWTYDSIKINDGETKVIDLNGHSMTAPSMTRAGGGCAFSISNGATVTVKNGTLVGRTGSIFSVNAGANVTFENVDFKCMESPAGVDWEGDLNVSIGSDCTTLKFKGCNFDDAFPAFKASSGTDYQIDFTFEDCTFNGVCTGQYCYHSILEFDGFPATRICGTVRFDGCQINFTDTSAKKYGEGIIVSNGGPSSTQPLNLIFKDVTVVTNVKPIVSKGRGVLNVTEEGTNSYTVDGTVYQHYDLKS